MILFILCVVFIIIITILIIIATHYKNKGVDIAKKRYQEELDFWINDERDKITQNIIKELNQYRQDKILEITQQALKQKQQSETEVENYKNKRLLEMEQQVQKNINDCYKDKIDELKAEKLLIASNINSLKREKEELNDQITKIKSQHDSIIHDIELYQNQIDLINEERRLKEAEEAELNTYRFILTESDMKDIQYLDSISSNLIHPRILYKLIWSDYILPAFNEMIKRQFGDNIPKNIIYCIENVETGKKYIGKTAQTAQVRWTSHLKTSLGISDTSPSAIHKALKNHWSDFTFRVLEEVASGDDINKREKYYIDFFKANIYGYNIKG